MSDAPADTTGPQAATGIRTVFFDLDDTLFAHRAAVDLGLRAYLATLEGPFAGTDAGSAVTLWNTLEDQHFLSYLTGSVDHGAQRRARARDFASAHGVELDDDESESWFARYFEHYAENWVLHDDALDCLDTLTRGIPGIRIGIITNGDLGYQKHKIDRVGLADRVDGVIASGDVGAAKPDPEIFRVACGRFEVRPVHAAYVGDRLRTDAIGAAESGMAGIWLNRSGDEPAADAASEARALGVTVIRTLAELPDVLTRRRSAGDG